MPWDDHPGRPTADAAEARRNQPLGEVCRACGYDEIITYSFISPACYDKIRWPEDYAQRKSFQILNPLGEDTSHHAHHHPALHAGDPHPQLELPQQVRQAV